MIFLILTYLALIISDAWWDYYKITRLQVEIDHVSDTAFAAVLYIYVSWVFREWLSLQEILAALCMLPACRWLLHDILLNVFRGLPIDYLGEGSLLDRLLKKIHLNQFILKAAAIAISAVLTTLIQK
jgi:hypothetical protein